MSKLILAVDPGLTGAFALLAPTGDIIAVEDLPVIREASLAWIDGSALLSRLMELRNGVPVHAIVEQVSSMPKQGVASTFAFGVSFGSLLSVLQVLPARIELVRPAEWKRAVGLTSKTKLTDTQRKRRSLDKARLLYPDAPLDRQKDHGRAEALLLAHWHMTRSQLRAAA